VIKYTEREAKRKKDDSKGRNNLREKGTKKKKSERMKEGKHLFERSIRE